jgi:4-amino-4-deoxy-L-arabinose transferase-like glycosyltransferase
MRPALVAILALLIAASHAAMNTSFDAPPRFDGAAYAVLARSLGEGRGYREIEHPDAPRHAHYPPGYPLALAAAWGVTGPSNRVAHAMSVVATAAAAAGFAAWFARPYPIAVAAPLALALAVNWRWGREGGAILTEPAFLAWTALALLAASWAGRRRDRIQTGLLVGLPLGAATLTRQVGVGLVVAVVADLLLRGRRRTASGAALAVVMMVLPWLVWARAVGRPSQLGLVPSGGFLALIHDQALFYARRVPDQVIGPVVEVGTVFRPGFSMPATAFAVACSAVVALGWWRLARSPRRRLAGLVPAFTMPILLLWPFTEAGRFLIPLLPMVLVGAVEGLAWIAAIAGLARHARRRAAVVILVLSLPYSAYALLGQRARDAEHAQRGFDAACRYLASRDDRPGLVLSRHAAEVFLQTGRMGMGIELMDIDTNHMIDRLLKDRGVAFLLVDGPRFARAPENPLARLAASLPDLWRLVWGGPADVAVYEVISDDPERVTGPRR